ncbi:MAG: NAD-dependent deacylase [Firmicutes bacterium]|nr:NAD-dependent deacylase [Bacillota bacterium]MDD4263341.1 NAD-dependent deacylase [Bacillota bacterium]MDD4693071.1 NAD-dependent deacylase [Bacillota bacterium]
METLAKLIKESNYTVVLTGAGVSTGSGIPDFRGPKGLWQQVDPMDALSTMAFYRDPKGFYDFYFHMLSEFEKAEPNKAHLAIAKLEEAGYVKAVITQNIDELHQRAGSKRVLEIHGTTFAGYCLECQKESPLLFSTTLPKCICGGLIRPKVVLFGDGMPETYLEAEEETHKADLVLVIGSSLAVSPACFLPLHAKKMAIINLEPTPYDDRAVSVSHKKAEDELPKLLQFLDLEGQKRQEA